MSRKRFSIHDDDVIHTALLRGSLAIKVTDVDVRREFDDDPSGGSGGGGGGGGGSGRGGGLLSSLLPIETDYILQVQSTNKVKFDEKSMRNMSVASQKVQEFETYFCSKRYVDIRNLASSLRDEAEDVVRECYEATKGKSKSTLLGSFEKGLGKVLAKPIEVAHYVTNTETGSSDLASHLDNVYNKGAAGGKKQRHSHGGHSQSQSQYKMSRRASERLDKGTPTFVREIIAGVDEFYEAIYSEKRQFGKKKSSFAHVKSVSERRRAIIDAAFAALANALASADIDTMSKLKPASMPVSLKSLVKSLERFLLTDMVVEEGKEGTTNNVAREPNVMDMIAESPEDSVKQRHAPLPVSTRRRASVVDRLQEMKEVQSVAELVCIDDKGSDDVSLKSISTAEVEEMAVVPPPPPPGLLPDNPIGFGIVVVAGAVLFKALEDRVVDLQMDTLLVFGIACGLVGYRLAASPAAARVQERTANGGNYSSANQLAVAVSPRASPTNERVEATANRGLDRRAALAAIDVKRDPSQKLIRKSFRNVYDMVEDGGEKNPPAEPAVIIPAKTFPKFPDGAAIGSNLNCWSSPPSTNFSVRGPNYLTDKKKVPSKDYIFPSRGCDLFLTDNPPVNMGRNRSILGGKLRDVPTFIINYRLPWGVFLSYHEIPERFLPFLRRGNGHGDLSVPLPSMAAMTAGDRAVCNFLLSDDDDKDQVLKIVPVVAAGPWVVKKVVGGKPAIIGTKMPISYVYQPPEKGLAEYLEADLDIVSSAAARNILAVVRSYTQVLTIDLGYVVQGNKKDELPEQMLLGFRIHGIDPLTAEPMPEFDGAATMPELEDDGNETD